MRLTIDQLADLVDRLSVRNRTLDDKSRWTLNPAGHVAVPNGFPFVQLVPVNRYRRILILTCNNGAGFTCGNNLQTLTDGFTVAANIDPFVIDYETFGAGVCQAFFAVSQVAACVAGFQEVVAPNQI